MLTGRLGQARFDEAMRTGCVAVIGSGCKRGMVAWVSFLCDDTSTGFGKDGFSCNIQHGDARGRITTFC